MACNWLMMTSSGDNNGRVGVWACSPTKLKIPKAEQETAQPTAARFNEEKVRFLLGAGLRRGGSLVNILQIGEGHSFFGKEKITMTVS